MATTALALSKAEQNALYVSYDVLGAHVELDMDFVKKYLVRGKSELISDQEIILFMQTCRAQNLNPLVQGEVYLIKYSDNDPAQIQVGKGAYLRRAFEHPNYLAKEDGITVKRGTEIIQKGGCCPYPGEDLLGGWCKIYYERGGRERVAYKEVALIEYNKGMANWKSKPATMINKVAISQCVREAFPKEYEGLYSEEELVASGVINADDGKIVDIEPEEPADLGITQQQRKMMFTKARTLFGQEGGDVVRQIISEFGYTSTNGMTESDWKQIMDRIDEFDPSGYEVVEDSDCGELVEESEDGDDD
jgi:phage recombination protein Bet